MPHGSKRPPYKIVPKWVDYSKEQIEDIISKLVKERYTIAQIGMILRDQYGIPNVKTITRKKISQIIEKQGVKYEVPEELMSLLRKAVNLRAHLVQNKKDNTSKYGLEKLESRIRRLGKYYVRVGKLQKGWKYDAEKAKLIIQK
jgi:small subunit ribosomal protein S15